MIKILEIVRAFRTRRDQEHLCRGLYMLMVHFAAAEGRGCGTRPAAGRWSRPNYPLLDETADIEFQLICDALMYLNS